jgi:integrase
MARHTDGYGDGSVYESPKGSGRWIAQVPDGHGKYLRKRAKSREEAKACKTDLIRERDQKIRLKLDLRGGMQTLEHFVLAEWWPACKARNLAPKTLEDYSTTVEIYLLKEWGQYALDEITVPLALSIHKTLAARYSADRAHRVLAKLSMILRAAIRRRYIAFNAVEDARPELATIERKEADPLTPEQTLALLVAVEGHRLCVLYHLALTLGMRLGELLGLQWGDIEWKAKTLTIRRQVQEVYGKVQVKQGAKTKAGDRILPLPPRIIGRLRALWDNRADSLFLFPSDEGTIMAPSNFERHFRGGKTAKRKTIKGIRAKAGLPASVKFHHLRHTASTRIMERGVPDEIHDRIFGWGTKKDIRYRYSHATLAAMRRAIEEHEAEMWREAA